MSDELRAALISCKAILAKLQAFEAAPATSRLRHDRLTPRGAESRIPSGVRLNASAATAPDKDSSLWGYYYWHMVRAQKREDVGELVKLAACATRDWEIHTGKARPSHHEAHAAAVNELLSDHTGRPSAEVAWRLDVPEKWVRRQRIVKGRDPDFGRPKPTDSRTTKILALYSEGLKQGAIAKQVGISQGRVSQILNGTR